MSALNYDIVAMLEESDSPAKLLFSMWEKLSASDYTELLEEEKVLLNAWNFDSAFGNGINDLLANENYDVIASGLKTMRLLGPFRLCEFAATLEGIFAAFGIDVVSGDDIAKLEELPALQRMRLQAELESAEGPYLKDLWEAGALTIAAKDYLIGNLEVFKRRKQGN